MDNWTPEQWTVFVIAILFVGIVGATLSRLHEKRHPYFKPSPNSPARPSRGPLELLAPIIWWCIRALLALGAFVLALFILIKLIKLIWYF